MKTSRTLLAVGAAVASLVLGGSQSASAGWFSHGSSGGSHGSSGGSWGSSGGSWGSSGGSWGSSGGSHGSWGSSGGSWGSSGGSHGSSGGSWGSYGGYYAAPVAQAASPATATNVAYLNLNVPEDAVVYLQDQRMSLTGARRRFVSPSVADGKQHVYTIRVEVQRDGRLVSKTTTAPISAGQEVEVTVTPDAKNANELVASVASR